jgi:hypothetical protein
MAQPRELIVCNRSNEPFNVQVTFKSPGAKPVSWDPIPLMPQATSDLYLFQGSELNINADGLTSVQVPGSIPVPGEGKEIFVHIVRSALIENPDIALIGIEIRDAEDDMALRR